MRRDRGALDAVVAEVGGLTGSLRGEVHVEWVHLGTVRGRSNGGSGNGTREKGQMKRTSAPWDQLLGE